MSVLADAVDAWIRWDDQPSERSRAVRSIVTLTAYAASMDVPATVVTRLVQEARRDGLTVRQAFARVAAVGHSDQSSIGT